MYAIVATGGKQYKVQEGDTIEVEKLVGEAGTAVELDVVFISDGSKITTDEKTLAKAKVHAEIVEHFKGEKALVFKFKKRKGYKRLRGHRQDLTKLLITAISLDGAAPKKTTAKKAADKVEEKPAKKTAAKKEAPKAAAATEEAVAEKKPAAKKTAAKTEASAEKKPAAKKEKAAEDTAEKKPAAKKTTKKAEAAEVEKEESNGA
jgi:large subunit ribosomal protein L21